MLSSSFEPAAVVDAYAAIKILTKASPDKEIGVVVNAARDGDEAAMVFRQLDVATTRFLERSLRFYGFVVEDAALREAVLGQRPIVECLPQAPASRCFRILASRIAGFAPAAARHWRAVETRPRRGSSRCVCPTALRQKPPGEHVARQALASRLAQRIPTRGDQRAGERREMGLIEAAKRYRPSRRPFDAFARRQYRAP